MKVKKRLQINVAISISITLVIIFVVFMALYRVSRANSSAVITSEIIAGTFERVALRNEYMRTGKARAQEEWFAKQDQLRRLQKAASKYFLNAADKTIIDKLNENHESITKLFSAFVANRERKGPGPGGRFRETEDRLLNQLDIRVSEAARLTRELVDSNRKARAAVLREAAASIILLLLLAIAATVANSLTMSRALADRIYRLRNGARQIGEGDLDHRIDIKGDDEFAELSEAFNAMTAKLRVSHDTLGKEIEERKRAEGALRKAHDELETRVMERTEELVLANDSAKRERQRLYSVMETLPVYVILLTPDYHVPFANRFFRERFGDSGGRRCYEYLFDRTEPCEICETYTVLKTNETHHWYWTGPDKRDYDIHDFPFVDSDGSPLILEMGIDITEQKKAQQELREMNVTLELRIRERTAEINSANAMLRESRNEALRIMEDAVASRKQAEETNRELEAFIYSVSHDLREPLRSVSGFARIVQENYADRLDEQGRNYLARIARGAKKMSRLIEDLLYLSRIARHEITRTNIDMSGIAQAITAELRESRRERHVEFDIQKKLADHADSRLTAVALWNILGNAWKFTEQTAHARVEFGAVDNPAEAAARGLGNETMKKMLDAGQRVYYVRDNGAGFDQEHAHKMFLPFHRLHAADQFPGTGIGLAIVESVIRRHGGQVWAEGARDKGAIVYFTLS